MTTLDDTSLSDHRRAGSASRALGRRRIRGLVRSRWWLLLGMSAACWLSAIPALLTRDGDTERGFVLGFVTALSVALPGALVLVFSGAAGAIAGDNAEQWTASELEVLRAQGWRVAHHLLLAPGREADHVLVGPGGVLVVETKWSSYSWQMGQRPLDSAIGQVSARSRDLKKVLDLPVQPVVVLWGEATDALAGTSGRIDRGGVKVMTGQALEQWLLGRGRDALNQEQQDSAWAAIVALAEAGDETEGPVPAGLMDQLESVATAVGAGAVTFVAITYAASWHLLAGVATLLLSAGTAVVLRRRGRRVLSVGVLAGATGMVALVLAAAALSLA